jgi:hypothetical protein
LGFAESVDFIKEENRANAIGVVVVSSRVHSISHVFHAGRDRAEFNYSSS